MPETKAPDIQPYDFRRPTTLAREHSRVLEGSFETFARQWGTQLTARVRAKATVACEHVTMQSYDSYVATLPQTTTMVLFAVPDTESRLVIQFPTHASLSWVGRMLGAPGDAAAEDRKYTTIEHRLITTVMADAAEALGYSLGAALTTGNAVDSVAYNSQFAQAAGTGELMIVAGFKVTVGDTTSQATIAIPADVVLAHLGAATPTPDPGDSRTLALAQLGLVPLEVGVQLAPVPVRPGAVLDLAVGDVVALPHPVGRPYHLVVDGLRLATAAPVAARSRAAAQIIDLLED